uniref:RING-type E3 ubiquitin transferase n=1 Tax=Serinus canaria TaxID=9135 RepID=A0A8C9MLV2_SERCA
MAEVTATVLWRLLDTSGIDVSVLPFQGELLNPCRCDGSVRYTHQLCLLKWISERGSWTCELCCYRYHVIAIKMKKPCQVICSFKKKYVFSVIFF